MRVWRMYTQWRDREEGPKDCTLCSGRPLWRQVWKWGKITGVKGIEAWVGREWVSAAGAWQTGWEGQVCEGRARKAGHAEPYVGHWKALGFSGSTGEPLRNFESDGSMRPTSFSLEELLLKKKKDFLQSSFRFTGKLKRRCGFLVYPCTCLVSPSINIGTSFTIDEPTLTHHNQPESVI